MDDTREDELAVLFPVPRIEVISGRSIAIAPLKLRQIAPFSAASEPFWPVIISGDYLAAVTHHTDAVIAALVIATGCAPDWLDELGAEDMMRLAAAVFEVNIDFFVLRLFPLKRELGARIVALVNSQPPSPGLSAPDTASPNAAI